MRTLDGSVFVQCLKVHTQPNTLKSGDRNLLKKKELGNRAVKAKAKVFGNKKQDNESSHRQAFGNKGRVAAKTNKKEFAGTARTSMNHCLGKFTSTYRRSWTLRIHQSKSWARQKRTY